MKRDGQKSKSTGSVRVKEERDQEAINIMKEEGWQIGEAEKRLEQKGWIWVVLIAIDAGKATDHRELDCVKGDYALTMGLALSMNFTFLAFLGWFHSRRGISL